MEWRGKAGGGGNLKYELGSPLHLQWGQMQEKMTPIWSQLSSMIDDKQGTKQMEAGVNEGDNPPDSDYLHLHLEISLSRHLE